MVFFLSTIKKCKNSCCSTQVVIAPVIFIPLAPTLKEVKMKHLDESPSQWILESIDQLKFSQKPQAIFKKNKNRTSKSINKMLEV